MSNNLKFIRITRTGESALARMRREQAEMWRKAYAERKPEMHRDVVDLDE